MKVQSLGLVCNLPRKMERNHLILDVERCKPNGVKGCGCKQKMVLECVLLESILLHVLEIKLRKRHL
jgi:hypothetical protein